MKENANASPSEKPDVLNPEGTGKGGFRNWWYYHKWYVFLGILIVIFLFRRAGAALGLFEKKPDLQIAYWGSPLPQETVDSMHAAFSSVCGDYNKDGEVLVALHLYNANPSPSNDDEYYYQYASEVEMIGDITDCDSYLFVAENPLDLQKRFQILALADGSEPAENDFSVTGKCFLWSECPMLSGSGSGASGEGSEADNELLSSLSVGRRFFHDEKTVKNLKECEALWNTLAISAKADTSGTAANEEDAEVDSAEAADSDEDSTEIADADAAGLDNSAKEIADADAAGLDDSSVEPVITGPFRAPETFDDFTLLDNKDVLAASGLYYATWVSGSPVPYQNSDGETVDLYDAQLYFLVQEFETSTEAGSTLSGWQSAAEARYKNINTEEKHVGEFDYTVMTYECNPETSPFDHGVSAFSSSGNYAFVAELTCREGFSGDLSSLLDDFLSGLKYIEE